MSFKPTINTPFISNAFNAFENSNLTIETLESAVSTVVFSTDKDGKITSLNNAFRTQLGYSDVEAKEINLSHLIASDTSIAHGIEPDYLDNSRFIQLVEKISIDYPSDTQELLLTEKKGSVISYISSFTGVFNDKNLTGFLFFAINISEQKNTDKAWRESENKFRLLAENIPGTIYLCKNDPTFTPIYLNDHIEELTGYTADEFMRNAVNFVQLYHPEDVEMIFDKVEKALEAKVSFHLQYRLKHKNGTFRWINEVGVGLYAGDELIMLEGYMSDITDQKKAEDDLKLSRKNLELAAFSLQQQNNQLNSFAHILSHNLRSPVGNISALISLLNEKSSVEDYRTIFENLQHTAISLQETLNDLMETLRIKKETDIQRSRLSFEETLKKVQQDLAGEVIKVNAIISSDFSICPEIIYPKTYLESIFLNLLSNSIKYRSPERRLAVHFSSYMKNGKIELSVSDNGTGIDLEKHGEELFGLRKTFHEHPEAKGVGLFLTKTQIETMGGTIRATSKLNQGTTFIIQF